MATEADSIHAVQLVPTRGAWTARAWYRTGPGKFAAIDYGLHASPAAAEDGFFRMLELMDNDNEEAA